MTWVNAVVQGALLGGNYALLAAGLSIMFGVMRIINLAHGDLAVLGTYVVWALLAHAGVPVFAGLAISLAIMLGVGYALQLTVLERSLRGGMLTPLLATFGLAVVIQNGLLIAFSPDVQSLGGDVGALATASWQVVGGLSLPAVGLATLATAAAVVESLELFLTRTRAGAVWRAVSEDVDVSRLVGIDARRVYATATAVAVALAALGGFALAVRSTFDPTAGPVQLIFAFEAVVIGGLGSLRGTLIGGIALGVAQTIGANINPQYAVLAGNVLFLGVLAVRSGAIRPGRQVVA